jgi:phosphopentomutase
VSAPFSRVIVIVLDSVGAGALSDAAVYGDDGSNTLGNIARQVGLRVPALRRLGLDRIVDIGGFGQRQACRPGRLGRMAEASMGKDSVTGHWEMMGIVLERPFPVFPDGFPKEMIDAFERRIGRGTLGNYAASGTKIIDDLGAEHMRTGKPIVYTSADSVFQIAAHEDVIPLAEQYRINNIAFDLVVAAMASAVLSRARSSANPDVSPAHPIAGDFAMVPTSETTLDRLTAAHVPVVAIGKIDDLFAGRGVTRAIHTKSDAEGCRCSVVRDGIDHVRT